jgi:hypothetical protein
MVMAAITGMEMGRHFMAAALRRRGDQGESGLDAGVELAERGARRAVMDADSGADCMGSLSSGRRREH